MDHYPEWLVQEGPKQSYVPKHKLRNMTTNDLTPLCLILFLSHIKNIKDSTQQLNSWGLVLVGGLGLNGPEHLSMRVRLHRSLGNVWCVAVSCGPGALVSTRDPSSQSQQPLLLPQRPQAACISSQPAGFKRAENCRLCLSISLTRTENSNFVEQFSEHYATEWASFKNFIAQ